MPFISEDDINRGISTVKKILAILLVVMIALLSVSLTTAEGSASVKEGDIVTFGRYPQTAEGTDQTPIEWIVLELQDGKALVISRYGLDVNLFYMENVDVTWETCSLRAWLNSDFLNTAFTPEEQAAIPVTEVDNSAEQGFGEWNMNGGNNTQDHVFLLSYAEANRYFGLTSEENIKTRVQPTDYAAGKGAWSISDCVTESGAEAGWWWLRSPGFNPAFTKGYFACVMNDGRLYYGSVDFLVACYRPALWINLESDIFKFENPQ